MKNISLESVELEPISSDLESVPKYIDQLSKYQSAIYSILYFSFVIYLSYITFKFPPTKSVQYSNILINTSNQAQLHYLDFATKNTKIANQSISFILTAQRNQSGPETIVQVDSKHSLQSLLNETLPDPPNDPIDFHFPKNSVNSDPIEVFSGNLGSFDAIQFRISLIPKNCPISSLHIKTIKADFSATFNFNYLRSITSFFIIICFIQAYSSIQTSDPFAKFLIPLSIVSIFGTNPFYILKYNTGFQTFDYLLLSLLSSYVRIALLLKFIKSDSFKILVPHFLSILLSLFQFADLFVTNSPTRPFISISIHLMYFIFNLFITIFGLVHIHKSSQKYPEHSIYKHMFFFTSIAFIPGFIWFNQMAPVVFGSLFGLDVVIILIMETRFKPRNKYKHIKESKDQPQIFDTEN